MSHTEYKYMLNRSIQTPLAEIEYSKNIVEATARWDSIEEVQEDLRILFKSQMENFKLHLNELKEADDYIRAMKALKIFEHLKTTPAWNLIKLEIAKLQSK